MDRNRSTGILYAFGASVALAGSFIFSKSVLNQLNIVCFGLLWFSMGVVWNIAWFLFRKEYRDLADSFLKKTLVAIMIALLEAAATGLFYLAIKEMINPAVVSFIGNIGPVFVTIFGLLLLKERFRLGQMAGIVITILGVSLINYSKGGLNGFTDPGSLYVIGASFLFAWATIAGRKFRNLLVPGYMSLLRSFLLTLSMALLFATGDYGKVLPLGFKVLRDIFLGSFLETMIVIVFAYKALILIEATRTSLIISTKGIWTLLFAWLFLSVFPEPVQLAGGLLSLLGVWMINAERLTFRRAQNGTL